MHTGWLVELPDQKGIGKIVTERGDSFEVSIFQAIGQYATVDVPKSKIRRAFLAPQTRAYVQRDERTFVGRVIGWAQEPDGSIDYEVRFPNGGKAELPESEIFVRPWLIGADPAEILAAGGSESQFLHDRRQSAMSALQGLIGAAEGLTSLISSGIDLVPHQVAAVRRVLNDPIQRYLLADEVGLGKTIEAGLIIRQHLIDDPLKRALVVAPEPLVNQWSAELRDKLRLDQFGDCFDCVSHEQLAKVTKSYPIVVIDEAHHMVGEVAKKFVASSVHVRELSAEAEVLLLLSATPPVGEERKFLAMLNLLDPLTHPLDDIEGFRTKLEQRRPIGRLLLSLDPSAPGLVLRRRGAELQDLYPDDPVVRDLVPKLVAASREAPERLPSICAALKQHVADGYRIHHRVIRSRRADAQGWEFRPRGPKADNGLSFSHVRVEEDNPDAASGLMSALEDWRYAAVDHALREPKAREGLVSRYKTLLSTFAEGVAEFAEFLATAEPLFHDEKDYLHSLEEALSGISPVERLDVMAESTARLIKTFAGRTGAGKIVVFAATDTQANEFITILQQRLPEEVQCLRHRTGAVEEFLNASTQAVFITDFSGEEGLNVSFADAIVHLNLPFSVGRIEQRIGRLDRYGRRQDVIRHRVHLPSDEENSPWSAWYHILAKGFTIFHRSISDIQFLLDDLEQVAFSALFDQGSSSVAALVEELQARIEEERTSQDEQYALDRIALAEDPVEPYVDAIENSEMDEAALEADIEGWLVRALLVRRTPATWPEPDPFMLSQTKRTLIPHRPWLQQLLEGASGPVTWRRQTAVKGSGVSLLRPGNPCIDSLYRYTKWDDRGTAFITLRHAPGWESGTWIGYKLCFAVEAALYWGELLSPTIEELALSRRAQRYLPIRSHELYVDINGNPVTDKLLLATLQRPYVSDKNLPKCDVNLGSRPEALAEIIDPEQLAFRTRYVRDNARNTLLREEGYVESVTRALELLDGAIKRHRNRVERAASFGADVREARAEIAVLESLRPAIEHPEVRLDAIGCFVIVPNPDGYQS